METARTRYELRVGTLVSPAALATFRVRLRPTAVPRSTVYRFRIPADRDLSEVLQRLIERGVELLEVRKSAEPRRSRRGSTGTPQVAAAPACPDVVVPLRIVTGVPEEDETASAG